VPKEFGITHSYQNADQGTRDMLNNLGISAKSSRKMDRSIVGSKVIPPSRFTHSSGVDIGSHVNLGVLTRESNDMRSNPWLKHKPLAQHRFNNGEGDLVTSTTGKRYGVDRMGKKEIDKSRKLVPDEYVEGIPGLKSPVYKMK
jgi:hypothetical protein